MKKTFKIILAAGCLAITACESKKAKNFSILADANIYSQDSVYQPRKIDVLWIVDNSGSMQTSQQKLVTNFKSFIEKFRTLKFDFHIGVGATNGWKTLFDPTKPYWDLRDGDVDNNIHSGVFVIDNNTPNIIDTFVTNASLGVHPYGDERAFDSFYATLTNPNNASFRRPDAFLAIIIVSDEDDFSHDSKPWAQDKYDDPTMPLYPVQHFADFLDSYTGRSSKDTPANYSVSAITIADSDCKTQLSSDGFIDRKVGIRHMELANLTGGTVGSLCDPFDTTLSNISDSIINYSSVFPLTRVPIVETIKVTVNGVLVPNDDVNGWTYREKDNSIWFHGTSTPPSGASIRIDFDPVGIKL